MITEDVHYGRAVYKEISEDLTLFFGRFRIWSIEASVSGLSVILPPADDMPLGCPVFYILNVGNRRLIVKNSEGTALQLIEINEAAIISRSQ